MLLKSEIYGITILCSCYSTLFISVQ